MKYLIYQYYKEPKVKTNHYIKTDYPYHQLSQRNMQKYCEKYGIEYRLLSGDLPFDLPPFFGIFEPFFENWVHEYDAVCFVDSDIFVTQNTRNIFEHVPDDRISANFMDTQNRMKNLNKGARDFSFWIDKGHINSGVVVFPRKEYKPLQDYLKDIKTIFNTNDVVYTSLGNFDQAFVNYYVRHVNRYNALPDTFNYHLTRKDKEKRFNQDFIHYHRQNKGMMKTDFNNEIILK